MKTCEELRRKADQHWEMAGLARQDNDQADADRHTAKAREYDRQAKEAHAKEKK